MAYKGAIVIPTTHPDSDDVIDTVEDAFESRLGGFSRYGGVGGWKEDGESVRELHVRIEAIGEVGDGFTGEFFRETARYVKHELDEDAVMVEITRVDVDFV